MKITKSQLREMIREEIQKLDEGKLPKHYGIYHDSSNSYILAYSRYNWEPSSSEIAKIEKVSHVMIRNIEHKALKKLLLKIKDKKDECF